MDSFGVGLASVLLLGVSAQWLAWRFKAPSILLLLLVGFAVGPLWEGIFAEPLLNVDSFFQREDSLLGAVGLAVAVILLEGGLSLRLSKLEGAARATRNMILLGAPITFGLATVTAHYILGWDWPLSALIGAILIVTGPTVIIPLLNHVRPAGNVASVVRWEGIVTDPMGAIGAVLVFKFIDAGGAEGYTFVDTLRGLGISLGGGCVAGAVAAFGFVALMKRRLVPDFLQTSVALALGVMAFTLANELEKESGLVAVTFMGVILANQKGVVIEHIVEFKENLRVLLISSLFIVLAARLPWAEVQRVEWRAFAFVAALILVVRPIVVLLATLGSGLTWPEKAFVAWMAPRGIVAAAVASVFSLELAHAGVPNADQLVSVTFVVIVVTVAVYGLTAAPVAKVLGLSRGNPQGVLLVGAHAWARQIAEALKAAGVEVLLADTNRRDIMAAKMAELPVHYGSILAEDFEDEVELDRIGELLCLTPNDEVNSLACIQFGGWFGRDRVFQLPPVTEDSVGEGPRPLHLRGQDLFTDELDYWDIQARIRSGAVIKRTRLTEAFTFEDLQAEYDREFGDAEIVPLFQVHAGPSLEVAAANHPIVPKVGSVLIALIGPRPRPLKPKAPAEPSELAEPADLAQPTEPSQSPEPSEQDASAS
ncbi:MAG: cation:proton antiporter [Planctomycetota bacterium]